MVEASIWTPAQGEKIIGKKIKTVKVSAKSTMNWATRPLYHKGMDAIIEDWARQGYTLVSTVPITKTKRGIFSTKVETTDYLLTFEKGD